MPPVNVFNIISVDQSRGSKSRRMWFVCNSRHLSAAIRIAHAEIPNTFSRAFGNRLNRLGIIFVNYLGQEIIYLVDARDCFKADVATDTANLTVLAHQSTFIVAIA